MRHVYSRCGWRRSPEISLSKEKTSRVFSHGLMLVIRLFQAVLIVMDDFLSLHNNEMRS